jgi:hypothetical protein
VRDATKNAKRCFGSDYRHQDMERKGTVRVP